MSYAEILTPQLSMLNAKHSLPLLPDGRSVSFLSGEEITVPIPKPLRIDVEMIKRKKTAGASGAAKRATPTPVLKSKAKREIVLGQYLAGPDIVVISRDFLEILKLAGVSNFQVFPAILSHKKSKRTWRKYYAFNAIGLHDAALLELSGYTVLSEEADRKYPLLDFKRLLFSKQKLEGGPKMFRLAHAPERLYVSGDVFDAISRYGMHIDWREEADGKLFKRIEIIDETKENLKNLRIKDALDAVTLFLDFWDKDTAERKAREPNAVWGTSTSPAVHSDWTPYLNIKRHLELGEAEAAYREYNSIVFFGMGGFASHSHYIAGLAPNGGSVVDTEYWQLENLVRKTLDNLDKGVSLEKKPLLKPTAESALRAAQDEYKNGPARREENDKKAADLILQFKKYLSENYADVVYDKDYDDGKRRRSLYATIGKTTEFCIDVSQGRISIQNKTRARYWIEEDEDMTLDMMKENMERYQEGIKEVLEP
jgi:hypothetical protein